MNTLPKVRLLIAWGTRSKGAVFQPQTRTELNTLLNQLWYGHRIAELVSVPEVVVPTRPLSIILDPLAVASGTETSVCDPQSETNPTPTRFGRGRNKRA